MSRRISNEADKPISSTIPRADPGRIWLMDVKLVLVGVRIAINNQRMSLTCRFELVTVLVATVAA